MTICCTAPGKLFLSGEYAVLQGAPAVVTAVNRRAVADLEDNNSTSPVVEAARMEAARRLVSVEGEIPRVRANSPNFKIRGKKVGLGSSAAVCAAASGIIYEWAGLPIEENRLKILEMATTAHRAAQGGKGSGGDVAVSVLGGTIVFSTGGLHEQVSNPSMELVAVWTGRSASTTHLVSQVDAFALRDELSHRKCFEDLATIADVLANAYRCGDVKQIIEQTQNYGSAMHRLGKGSGVPIVTAEHKLISNLAKDLGGAAKPSGAGGGDVALAIFEDKDTVKAFATKCVRFGLAPLDLTFQAPGLRREPSD